MQTTLVMDLKRTNGPWPDYGIHPVAGWLVEPTSPVGLVTFLNDIKTLADTGEVLWKSIFLIPIFRMILHLQMVRFSFSKLLAKSQNWSVSGTHPDAVQFHWSAEGYQMNEICFVMTP